MSFFFRSVPFNLSNVHLFILLMFHDGCASVMFVFGCMTISSRIVSRSYFLGELEKCVGDPDSLAQLFIKHVSVQISK